VNGVWTTTLSKSRAAAESITNVFTSSIWPMSSRMKTKSCSYPNLQATQRAAIPFPRTNFSRIRPLLTQDIKIRRVSGRVQISADGKHLVDGVAWGRPLLRKAGDRPAVNIPPRKRQRIEYSEGDAELEGLEAPSEKATEESDEDNNRQLVLHADFDDEDEEDDDDFASEDEGDAEEDGLSEEDLEGGNGEEEAENKDEPPADLQSSGEDTDNTDEPALADINDQAIRAKIRKLHSAFPKSPLAVCKYVFNGSEDIGEAYEAMARGFIPEKAKSAVTEISQGAKPGKLSVPRSRSKAKTPSVHESENLDNMQVEPDETALVGHYDQNGLPKGSIMSGKALSFMAEALQNSPARSRSEPRRSASVNSNKSVRFALDGIFSNGLTSTPFIDKKSQVEEEESEEDSKEDSEEQSEDSSDSDTSSSEDSSDSSDEEAEDGKVSADEISSSESDSESSSSSSSDEESPEEASSKQDTTASAPAELDNTHSSQDKKPRTLPVALPLQGMSRTQRRNQRRRNMNARDRFSQKGVLPAGTTLAEFKDMKEDKKKSAGTAVAAREAIKSAGEPKQRSETPGQASSQDVEFQRRKQDLLASLAAGGVEVDTEFSRHVREAGSDIEMTGVEDSVDEIVESQQVVDTKQSVEVRSSCESRRELQQSNEELSSVELQVPAELQEAAKPFSTALNHIENTSTTSHNVGAGVQKSTPSSGPETAAVDTPLLSPKPLPASVKSSQPSSSRRAKLDLSAGRRLLFGALGRKAPKTKADEEKIRKDIMRDVRPLLPEKTTEEQPSSPTGESTDDDVDAWKQKINYQAKECVQDGVVLTEPPFPFEQRWDPQQRGGYKGGRGGKRKKDQRDQAQYYHDDDRASKKQKQRKGKHNYALEQEYLDASYEPSFQDDTLTSQFDDATQAEGLHSEDVEGEISQQLMNDTQTPIAVFSQGPEDLAPLPDDPSILPVLEDGQAKVGMTIAFKQLEMSAATNWQPQLSAYRTAIVIAITETGELQLTLAMRDRQQFHKRYDPQTGERIYSKFEAPDDDGVDEDENDGMLNLGFGELTEPKIVQEPPANLRSDAGMEETSQAKELTSFETTTLSHEELADNPANETPEAQFSHVTETPLNSNATEPSQLEGSMLDEHAESPSDDISLIDDSILEPSSPSADDQLRESMIGETVKYGLLNDDATGEVTMPSAEGKRKETTLATLAEPAPNVSPIDESNTGPDTPSAEALEHLRFFSGNLGEQLSEQNRQAWSHLMKEEGGFHSSVPSSFTKLVRPEGMDSPDDLEKLAQDMSETPLHRPYSPKFNGLGSSPTRKSRDATKSPATGEPKGSLQTPQSSWETVDDTMDSQPQILEQPQKSLASPTAATALEKMQPEKEKKALLRTLPPSRGLQALQALKQRKRSPTPSSDVETSKTSPVPRLSFGLDGVDERELVASVRYPELSVGSSFTSQVADYGRQPDFTFEDTLDLNPDTPKAASLEYDDMLTGPRPDLPRPAPQEEVTNSESKEGDMSDIDEPELPPRKSVNTYKVPERSSYESREDDLSSDELELPTIEEMVSSQMAMKRERGSPTKSSTKKNAKHKKTMDALDDDIFDDNLTTAKASQKQRDVLDSQLGKGRDSEKPASQPRVPNPRASQLLPSQSQPQASQIVDLTISSEPEPESDSEHEKKFRRPSGRYNGSDDDSYEEDNNPKIGWISKKDSKIQGGDTRRHTSVGLRLSSQASLNTQNRRKTSAR
jgi:hypothetical protein